MLTGDEHALIRRQAKALRSLRARNRRRRGLTPAVSWARPFSRCTGCGRWVSESGTAGWGDGARWCAGCALALDVRRASVWALASARTVALSGAA